jgi:hypothetical protein
LVGDCLKHFALEKIAPAPTSAKQSSLRSMQTGIDSLMTKLRINRRLALIGLGGLVTIPIIKGCGGGGGGDSGGGSSGLGSSSSAAGSIWYKQDRDLMMVPNGGTGTPTKVASILPDDGIVSSYFPSISRRSTRYAQVGFHGPDSNATMIRIFDHATHQLYGFVDMWGLCSPTMSPSGRYIGMDRSPNIVDEKEFAGFAIVDIADINNVSSLRETMPGGDDYLLGFDWLDNDRFIYMNRNGNIFTGAAGTPSSSDQALGQLDQLGRRAGGFSVHPDGKTMLVTLSSPQSASQADIYLYNVTGGPPIARMTSMDACHGPQWSPDGNYFMFTFGSPGQPCSGCASGCTQFLASLGGRELKFEDAQQFDALKVNCVASNTWSSVA